MAPSADLGSLYRRAFHAAAEGIVIHEEGRILAANHAARRILGTQSVEGRRILDLVPPGVHHDVREAMRSDGQCEVRLLPSEGPAMTVLLRALSSPDGQPGLVILRDVSGSGRPSQDRKDERDAEVARLEQLNHFKTQLLNTAAHELNTPLTPLRLQVHLLRSQSLGRLSDRQARAVDVLERSTDRLTMLVSDILDVARLESGHLGMELEDARLRELVEEAVQAYEETARGVGVSLVLEGETDLTVRVDPRRILQVLYNLLSNAIKFTPEGGRVCIRTSSHGTSATVEVEDTGLGMDARQLEALFQPFSRVHDTETTAIPGTGLGLYISRGIVQQHGGRLDATSAGPGHGACFRFTVPVAAGPLRRTRPRQAHSPMVAGPLAQRLRELI